MSIARGLLVLSLGALPVHALAADPTPEADDASVLKGFGAGPAFYFLRYKDEFIEDPRDVRLRGDGTLEATQTRTSTSLGAEIHYGFGGTYNIMDSNDQQVVSTWGWTISPYAGVFDVNDGINGIAFGFMGGVWRGDDNGEVTKALNVGVGYFVHKRRLVLANDVALGEIPPEDLEFSDFTRKRDIEGWTVTISASVGF